MVILYFSYSFTGGVFILILVYHALKGYSMAHAASTIWYIIGFPSKNYMYISVSEI